MIVKHDCYIDTTSLYKCEIGHCTQGMRNFIQNTILKLHTLIAYIIISVKRGTNTPE
jgi:hypothetical protein